MLENVLFFINITKIVVSFRRFVIRLQRLLYFCAEISLYYSALSVVFLVEVQGLVLFHVAGTLAPAGVARNFDWEGFKLGKKL